MNLCIKQCHRHYMTYMTPFYFIWPISLGEYISEISTQNLTLRRRVEVRNSIQRFKTQERTIAGICSKGLLRKSTYSCGNHVIVKFNNPNYNSFVVKIAAVNDTDTFVKPRECKIGDIQHTSQLIPRNRDGKVDPFSHFKILTLTFHPMKLCSLFYNKNSQ